MSSIAAVLRREERGFLLLWSGQSVSLIGDQVSALALPLAAVRLLDASAVQVSVLTALQWTPALLGVLAGTWIDRRSDTRALMVAADLGRALVLLSLPAAALLGRATLVQLYLVALVTGAISVVFNTSYSAFFVRIVRQESYIQANSRLSVSRSAAQVAGPAIGGALVQALGAPMAVLADALSFLVSAAFLGRIRLPERAPRAGSEIGAGSASGSGSVLAAADRGAGAFRRELRQGWSFVVGDPIMRASLGCSTTVNFFTFVAGTGLFVLFATRTLGLSAATLGAALGIGAFGSLLGAVLAGPAARRFGAGRAMAVGCVLFPASIALAAAASGPMVLRVGVLAACEFLAGVGVMLFDVNQNAIMAAAVPDGLRSRVAGVYSTVNYGIRPLGALAGGLLAATIGIRVTLVAAAVGGVLSLLWLLASPIPRIRTLDMIPGLRGAAADLHSPAARATGGRASAGTS